MSDNKLTIKPYLNKDIKNTEENVFQVYIRVIYRQKNTQIAYRKVILKEDNVFMSEEEFHLQYDAIKNNAENIISPIMFFLKKYQKDNLISLSNALPKLSKNMVDILRDMHDIFTEKTYTHLGSNKYDINEDYNTKLKNINTYIDKFNTLHENEISFKFFEYMDFKKFIPFNLDLKINRGIIKALGNNFSDLYDAELKKHLMS